jgi:heme exporter protein D
MLYGYWALGWLALTVLAFSAILVRSLMEQRRIYLRDRADR